MTIEEAIAKIIELYAMSIGNVPEYSRKNYGEAIAKVAMACNQSNQTGGYPWLSYRESSPSLPDFSKTIITCSDEQTAS